MSSARRTCRRISTRRGMLLFSNSLHMRTLELQASLITLRWAAVRLTSKRGDLRVTRRMINRAGSPLSSMKNTIMQLKHLKIQGSQGSRLPLVQVEPASSKGPHPLISHLLSKVMERITRHLSWVHMKIKQLMKVGARFTFRSLQSINYLIPQGVRSCLSKNLRSQRLQNQDILQQEFSKFIKICFPFLLHSKTSFRLL